MDVWAQKLWLLYSFTSSDIYFVPWYHSYYFERSKIDVVSIVFCSLHKSNQTLATIKRNTSKLTFTIFSFLHLYLIDVELFRKLLTEVCADRLQWVSAAPSAYSAGCNLQEMKDCLVQNICCSSRLFLIEHLILGRSQYIAGKKTSIFWMRFYFCSCENNYFPWKSIELEQIAFSFCWTAFS